MNAIILLFYLLRLSNSIFQYQKTCTCVTPTGAFQGSQTISSADSPIYSSEEEIINSKNYGKLVQFGTDVWIVQDFSTAKKITVSSSECPDGFELPSEAQYNSLINLCKSDYTILTNTFQMDNTQYYITQTKTYPSVTSGSENQAWEFKVLYFDKTIPKIMSVSTYWNENKLKARCLRKSTATADSIEISGKQADDQDYILNKNYKFSILNKNVIAQFWEIGSNNFQTKEISYQPNKQGCDIVKVRIQVFGGLILGMCMNLWNSAEFLNLGVTSFQETDITKVPLSGISSTRRSGFHFQSGTSPLAPKQNGDCLVAFQDKTTNVLKVQELSNVGVKKKLYDLVDLIEPFDVCEIPQGFAVLGKGISADSDSLYLFIVDENSGSSTPTIKKIVIMKNGNYPSSIVEQITFWSSESEPLFGLKAMYRPHNGKIIFARGRIMAIFAHYNHFGIKNGARDDHTGDTMYSFDYEGGSDYRLGWAWVTSHSLVQRILYDHRKVMTASLGDAYPQNIKVSVVEPEQVTDALDPKLKVKNRLTSAAKDIVEGTIIGSGTGKACGRLGGLQYQPKNSINEYSLTYARLACSNTFFGQAQSSAVDEMAIVFFDKNINRQRTLKLGPGTTVNQIRSVNYGRNILVLYVKTANKDGIYLPNNIQSDSQMYAMLLSNSGEQLTKETAISTFSLGNSDDLRALNDGRVAWVYVDNTGEMTYYYLPVPKCPKDCSNQGSCSRGICSCNQGFQGDDCSESTTVCPIFKDWDTQSCISTCDKYQDLKNKRCYSKCDDSIHITSESMKLCLIKCIEPIENIKEFRIIDKGITLFYVLQDGSQCGLSVSSSSDQNQLLDNINKNVEKSPDQKSEMENYNGFLQNLQKDQSLLNTIEMSKILQIQETMNIKANTSIIGNKINKTQEKETIKAQILLSNTIEKIGIAKMKANNKKTYSSKTKKSSFFGFDIRDATSKTFKASTDGLVDLELELDQKFLDQQSEAKYLVEQIQMKSYSKYSNQHPSSYIQSLTFFDSNGLKIENMKLNSPISIKFQFQSTLQLTNQFQGSYYKAEESQFVPDGISSTKYEINNEKIQFQFQSIHFSDFSISESFEYENFDQNYWILDFLLLVFLVLLLILIQLAFSKTGIESYDQKTQNSQNLRKFCFLYCHSFLSIFQKYSMANYNLLKAGIFLLRVSLLDFLLSILLLGFFYNRNIEFGDIFGYSILWTLALLIIFNFSIWSNLCFCFLNSESSKRYQSVQQPESKRSNIDISINTPGPGGKDTSKIFGNKQENQDKDSPKSKEIKSNKGNSFLNANILKFLVLIIISVFLICISIVVKFDSHQKYADNFRDGFIGGLQIYIFMMMVLNFCFIEFVVLFLRVKIFEKKGKLCCKDQEIKSIYEKLSK